MDRAKILVVDDEESMCKFMEIMLKREGYSVFTSQSGPDALERVKNEDYDLVIADLMMPEMSGLELLSRAKSVNPDTDFIMMTAFASVDSAIEALKNGAFDYVTKPFKVDEIKIAVKKSLEQKKIALENTQLKQELQTRSDFDCFIGNSSEIVKMIKMAKKIARSDSTVLIEGESGTGKELIASAIHYHSPRSDGPFVTINCAALPENLLESELFGHVKGSFTGAVKDKEGLFKTAEGGTFFLDEVGMTSPAIQAKLLRALHQCRSGAGSQNGKLQARPLLSPACHTHQDSRSARKRGRHQASLRLFCQKILPEDADRGEEHHGPGHGAVAFL
jgi:two-component system response regulator PilR (NtrC family)